jgi:hypothetical protein
MESDFRTFGSNSVMREVEFETTKNGYKVRLEKKDKNTYIVYEKEKETTPRQDDKSVRRKPETVEDGT